MTDTEIIKALECLCGSALKCRECPYSPRYQFPLCQQQVAKHALALINRQKAEIEKLRFEAAKLLPKDCPYAVQVEVSNKLEAQIKSEAVKEFATRLKKHSRKMQSSDFSGDFWDAAVLVEEIDNIVKEMVGDNSSE